MPKLNNKGLIKYFLAFFVVVLASCLCSCKQVSTSTVSEELPPLKIGIDASYEPYSYIDESGEYAGLDIELAKEACRRMGREPVFTAIKWNYKDAYLEDGTVDCIWSCFSMNGREDDYSWVGPYMYSRQVVAVCSDSDINSLADLEGKVVAVMSSTKPESIFLEPDNDGIPNVKNVYSMEDMNLAFSALQQGYADATAGHETVMRQYMETTAGKYRLLDEDLLSARIGVAFCKNKNADISSELGVVMSDMQSDGTLGEILNRYGIATKTANGGETD
jgi:polar amino acid transport system substrate-binding protein